MRKAHLILCLAGTILISACDRDHKSSPSGKVDTGAIADAIRADETQSLADWNAKDAAKVASHYSSDAVLMLPGMASMTGPDKIRPAVDGAVKDPNFSLAFKSDTVAVSEAGEMAYTRGTYTETYTDPKTKAKATEAGSFVTIYKKQKDGSWKAVEDIATPGLAPAPAAAPAAA